MSIEAVISEDLRLGDLVAAPEKDDKPIWDRLPYEEIIQYHWRHGFEVSVLTSNFDFYDEIIKKPGNKYEKWGEQNTTPLKQDEVSEHLLRNSSARLFKKDISEDFPLWKEISEKELNKRHEQFRNFYNLDEYLAFLFNYKLTYPSENLDEKIENILDRFPNFKSSSLNSETNIYWRDVFRSIAILRIFNPNLFNSDEILNSSLYKHGLNRARELFDKELFYDLILIAAYLKILSAEKVKLGTCGIELTMPEAKIESPTLALPDRRKF